MKISFPFGTGSVTLGVVIKFQHTQHSPIHFHPEPVQRHLQENAPALCKVLDLWRSTVCPLGIYNNAMHLGVEREKKWKNVWIVADICIDPSTECAPLQVKVWLGISKRKSIVYFSL